MEKGIEKNEFDQELYRQIEENIAEISSPDYQFMKPMTKTDWICIWGIAIICVIGVILGYSLM